MGKKTKYSLEEKMETAKRLVEFGHQLQELRLSHKLSLEEVGSALDVSKNYMSELERGRKMPSDLMVREIASFFKLNEDELFAVLGKIPLGSLEFLENNPSLATAASELTRLYKQKKITREQMEELIEEIEQIYDKLLESLE